MLASYFAQTNTDKHLNESRNCFVKRSNPGACLLIVENFHCHFTQPNWLPLTKSWSLRMSPFMRPFWSFVESRAKKPRNFSRSKVPFSDQEVCSDWSTFLTARFNRRSLGKDCVTSQKNVFVTCVWEATKFSHFGWSLRRYFLLFAWFTVLISILFTSYFIASSLAQTQCDRIVWDWQKSPFIYHLSQFNYERVCFNLREHGKYW